MPRKVAGAGLIFVVVLAVALLLLDSDEPERAVTGEPAQAAESGAAAGPERTLSDVPEPSTPPEPERLAERPSGPPEAYTRALGGLTGRILDSTLAPLPGLKVELMGGNIFDLLPSQEDWFREEPPDLSFVEAESRTDAEGRFRFEAVDPHGLFLLAIDAGGQRSAYEMAEAIPEPGRVADLGDIVLDPYVTLLGRVVDEAGAPVPDALVRASNLPYEAFGFGLGAARPGCAVGVRMPPATEWLVYPLPPIAHTLLRRLPYHQTRTGEDGSFRLEGVPIGTVTVLVDRDGSVPLVRGPLPTGAEGERTLPDLVLEEGSVLCGQVIDGDEQPVPGAFVSAGTILPFLPVSLLIPGGRTDAEGRFQIRGLPEQPHALAVRAADATGWKVVDGLEPGLDDPVIQLGPTSSITVTALDDASEVVRHPKVMLQLDTRFSKIFLLAPPLPLSTRRHELDDGSVRISGLSPGAYHVNVLAAGFAAFQQPVELKAGGLPVEVRLERELTGSVQVVTRGDLEPIEYALVSVFDVAAGQDNPFDVAPLLTRRTDHNGIAFLEGLRQGELNVRVFHPSYALGEAPLAAPGPPVLIELKGGGSLSGFVLRDGQPVSVPHWVIILPGAEADLKVPRLTRTDGTGAYRITHLRAGSYDVMVRDKLTPDGSGAGGGVFISDSHRSQEITITTDEGAQSDASKVDELTRRAEITEGETTRLDIDILRMEGDGPRGRLLGSVVLNGRTAPGCRVVARSSGSSKVLRAVSTNQRGIFDLGDVPAGELIVEVSRENDEAAGVLAARRVQVEPSDVSDVEFRIETGWLEGRVLAAADGRPVTYVRLRLLAAPDNDEAAAGGSLSTASDETGAFRFESVPAGAWLLAAEREGFARANVGPVLVPGRGRPPPLTLRLDSAVSVTGRIELPPGAGAAPYLFVQFSATESAESAHSAHSKDSFDFRGFAFVEPESRSFHIDELAPGLYRVSVMGSAAELQPVELMVPVQGLKNAILRPEVAVPAAPPEPMDEPAETGEGS